MTKVTLALERYLTASRANAPLDERPPSRRESGSKHSGSQSPPTRRWSLVGGADERLAARPPAASVSRLVTAECALDCSLIQWCFGRRARALRDDRVDRSTASDRTAPHRNASAVPRWLENRPVVNPRHIGHRDGREWRGGGGPRAPLALREPVRRLAHGADGGDHAKDGERQGRRRLPGAPVECDGTPRAQGGARAARPLRTTHGPKSRVDSGLFPTVIPVFRPPRGSLQTPTHPAARCSPR